MNKQYRSTKNWLLQHMLKALGWFEEKYRKKKKLELSRLKMIENADINKLTDAQFLETQLLPALGFNNEQPWEFPAELSPFCGQGLWFWQYPNQFSRYLVFLSQFKISSYLEIGIRWGGTFLILVEYLKRFNSLKKALAIDLISCPALDIYKEKNPFIEFHTFDSQTQFFRDFICSGEVFDLVFIDGDHSEDSCRYDFNTVKEHARIIAFHDIVNQGWKGASLVWQEVKQKYAHVYDFYEFTEQYPSVYKRMKKTYLGIGVAVRRNQE